MIVNDCFIQSLKFKKINRTPVWIMRQAGRYLPEYRKTRKKAGSFLNLCKNPDLAAEVTIQPIERFDLDAAIIFSDILVVLEAIGFEIDFIEKIGPVIKNPIIQTNQIEAISSVINDKLNFVFEAIKTTKKQINNKVPLIGFAGSPWTLLTYAIEGGKTQDQFAKTKTMIFNHKESSEQLLNKITNATSDYLKLQIKAGADTLMIFDSWGGALAEDDYQTFSLKYINKIIQTLKQTYPQTPIIVFTKGGSLWLEAIAKTGCNGIGLDWHIDIGKARKRLKEQKIALQGNLDPCYLRANNKTIETKVQKIIDSHFRATNSISGHIFNLGHGITPNISLDKVSHLVDCVHQISSKYI